MSSWLAVAAGSLLPEPLPAQTTFNPSMSVSERYDSNVFFGVVGQGVTPEDWVTNVSPQLTVVRKGQTVDGTVFGGFTAETYVNNPGLNYVGFNAGGTVDWDRLIQQYVYGAKLKTTGSVMYTPQLPNFITPTGSDENPSAVGEFVRGLQAARANSLTTTASMTSSVPLTGHTALTSTYMYSAVRFGPQFARFGSSGGFFDTAFHSATLGVMEKISPMDMLGFSYQYSLAQYSGAIAEGSNFSTHSWFGTYTHSFTPAFTVSATGGAVLLPPQFEGGKSILTYTASGSLSYRLDRTIYSLGYSRGVFPSIGVGALAMVSDTVIGTITQPIGLAWTGVISGNYGIGKSQPTGSFDYTAKGGSASLSYAIVSNSARTITASASYSYQDFEQTFLGSGFAFDRHTAMLSVRGSWNGL